jgi:hypothetical protein
VVVSRHISVSCSWTNSDARSGAKRADGSGDIVLQGFLTHRTSCGTYSVKTSQEGAQTGGAVDNVGRSESVKLVANDACSRAISGGLMLWVMLAVSVGVML